MEEDIDVPEDLIREEMIKEWCGKISVEDLPEIEKKPVGKLHENLKNSKLIEKVQKRISDLLLEKKDSSLSPLPGLLLDLSDDDFDS